MLFFALCFWYIFDKIRFEGFELSYFIHPIDFTLFFTLMLINWVLEAQKWKFLIRNVENLPLATAIKSTLAGLSFGLLTPNRMGNFVGKILYLHPENRVSGTLFALYGNLSQMITTFLFGSFCFLFTYEHYYSHINFLMAGLPLLFSIGLLFLFLFPGQLKWPFLNRIFSNEILNSVQLLSDFPGKGKVMGLAILRHFVFSFQYLIIFSYSTHYSFLEVFMAIQVIFFFTTMIPSLVFGKMMVRGPVAVFVMGTLGYSTSFVLSAILFIWMINIALPSLIGSFLFMIKKRAA